MTAQERIDAVARLGFTERQARFLVLVMQHSGVCLLRQYTAFAGIVHGQKTRNFFAKLIGRASTCPCRASMKSESRLAWLSFFSDRRCSQWLKPVKFIS